MNKKNTYIISIFFILAIIVLTTYCSAAENVYKINTNEKLIYRINPKTDYDTFIPSVRNLISNANGDSIEVFFNGSKVTSGYIKTGMSLVKNNTENYSLSVIGDVNQDGELNALDLTRLIKHIIGARNFQITDAPKLKAGDLTGDGNINVSDLTRMIKCIITSRLPEDPNPGGDNAKQNVNLSLSEISGQTTYPNIKTVEITKSADVELSVTSSNENVATANITGTTLTITPVGAGTSIITVTSAETNEYNAASAAYVITVEKGEMNVALEETQGTIIYPNTKNIAITNNSGGVLTVINSDSSVATASIEGTTLKIVPLKVGTATITVNCAATEKYNASSATYNLTVAKGEGNLVLSETKGETTYPNPKNIVITNTSGGTLTVSSSNTSVATASYNNSLLTVTPLKAGTATITVNLAATEQYSAGTATYNLTVNKGAGSITLNKTSEIVTYPDTASFSVTNYNGSDITVQSLNTSIASVSKSGNTITVTPLKSGTATIRVTSQASEQYNSAYADFTLNVDKATQNITATRTSGPEVLDGDRYTKYTVGNINGRTISVSSNNTSIVRVSYDESTGVINAMGWGNGEAIITVNASANDFYKTSIITLRVRVLERVIYIENFGYNSDVNIVGANGYTYYSNGAVFPRILLTGKDNIPDGETRTFFLSIRLDGAGSFHKIYVDSTIDVDAPNGDCSLEYLLSYDYNMESWDGLWSHHIANAHTECVYNITDSTAAFFQVRGEISKGATVDIRINDLYVTAERE